MKFPTSPMTLAEHSCWVFKVAPVMKKYISWDDAVKYGFQFYMYKEYVVE